MFGEVRALHGDKAIIDDGGRVVMGHLHPSLTIVDAAGASQKVPVFLVAERRVVLPPFSPFAAGFDIERGLPPQWGIQVFEVFAATDQRVVGIASIWRNERSGRASEWR